MNRILWKHTLLPLFSYTHTILKTLIPGSIVIFFRELETPEWKSYIFLNYTNWYSPMPDLRCSLWIDPSAHMNLNQGSSPWWLGLTPHCLPGEEVELQGFDCPPCLAGFQTLPPDWPPDCLEGAQRLLPEGVAWVEPQPLLLITTGALLICGVTEGKAWKKHN